MFCTIWSLWPSSIFGPAEPQRMHLRFAINKSALRKMEDINFGIWRTYPRNIRDLGGRNSRFLRNASQFWFKVWFPEVPCKKHKKHDEACPVLLCFAALFEDWDSRHQATQATQDGFVLVQDGPRWSKVKAEHAQKESQESADTAISAEVPFYYNLWTPVLLRRGKAARHELPSLMK